MYRATLWKVMLLFCPLLGTGCLLCCPLLATGCGDLMEVVVDQALVSTKESIEEAVDEVIHDVIDVDNLQLPFGNDDDPE